MILAEKTQQDITDTFGSKKQFDIEISEACKYIYGFDKFNLIDVKLYIDVLFDPDNHKLLIQRDLYCKITTRKSMLSIEKSYKTKPLRIFEFIKERIIENQEWALNNNLIPC